MAELVRNVIWKTTCVASNEVWYRLTALDSTDIFQQFCPELWHLMLDGSIGPRRAASKHFSLSPSIILSIYHPSLFSKFLSHLSFLFMSYLAGVFTTWDDKQDRKDRSVCVCVCVCERERALDLRADFVLESGGRLREIFHSDWNIREYFKRFCKQQKQTKHGGTYKYSTDKQQYHLSGLVEDVYVRENCFS